MVWYKWTSDQCFPTFLKTHTHNLVAQQTQNVLEEMFPITEKQTNKRFSTCLQASVAK